MLPPLSFNFRDLALSVDTSARSGVIDGGRFLDGSNWTIASGGSSAAPVNVRDEVPPGAGLKLGPAGFSLDMATIGLVVGLVVVGLILTRGK